MPSCFQALFGKGNTTANGPIVARPALKKEESAAPVRLLLSSKILSLTSSPCGVPCYELLPQGSYVDVDFEQYVSGLWKETAVISWRWGRAKPSNLETARNPQANPVPPAMMEYVSDVAKQDNITYIWLDWSCAPQYPADIAATMREVNRSGKYYATARGFYVWCYLEKITPNKFEHSDYVFRAWTLSERLHRAKNAQNALTAANFLPVIHLKDLFSPDVTLEVSYTNWAHTLGDISKFATSSASANAGRIAPEEGNKIVELLITRYPLLNATAAAVNGSLQTILPPQVHAALAASLRLRAVCEWITSPGDGPEDYLPFTPSPVPFKQALLQDTINHSRMSLNNFNHSPLSQPLEPLAAAASSVTSRADLASVLPALAALWSAALATPTAEVATPAWLRRYLVFEMDQTYRASKREDLLVAVHSLFGLPEARYGEEPAVYARLATAAGCAHLGSDDPYAWLRELAALGPDEREAELSVLPPRRNARAAPLATSASNFGAYAFDNAAAAAATTALPVPAVFGIDCGKEVLSHVVGFRLAPAAQAALAAHGAAGLSRVDKAQGGEIDTHLSLRGRLALGRFEDRLHAAIAATMAEPWAAPCGLFVVVRYGSASCLAQCVVLRASEGPGGWTAEHVAAFGSGAQKGSSWGVARSLDLLHVDLLALPGGCEATHASFGALTMSENVLPSIGGEGPAPAAPPWFSTLPLALRAGPDPAAAPASSDAAVAMMMAQMAGDMAMVKEALGGGAASGKTRFTAEDLARVERAHVEMVRRGFDAGSMNGYYEVLAANYVHDSIMAGQLAYFTRLCHALAAHVKDPRGREEILSQAPLAQKLENLVEDMRDAISDSDQDALKSEATAATNALEAAIAGS